ncbi:MAG: amino acid racemase [Planktothrix agardhii]|jgi:aspartate racemase|uniref:aspartate/glutamate racemase family protein n=1 Tax=Planktothrix agardhii TaxID=1160 RepID=UPI0024302C40|nr:amino acid racemase [Planktothrix agardhii]MCP9294108.1 amino acid racemase [Planktothrix agardhii LY1]
MNQLIKQQAIPGIIGGLGPLAHIELERHLIAINQGRGACCDQEYPVWFLINATDIPDRTQSIIGEVENCTPWLVKYGKILQTAGADFLVIPCNTSHAFYDQVQPQLNIPWIHWMQSTSLFIKTHYPQYQNIGVLATTGTLKTQLYHQSLTALGLNYIQPDLNSEVQNQIMNAIYHPIWGIKATGIQVSAPALEILVNATYWLADQGAELVIAGCTELSVGFDYLTDLPLIWVDPMKIMAEITLDLAWGYSAI